MPGGFFRVEAVLMAALLVLGMLVAGVAGWKYLHLDSLDDYREGFALGEMWRAEGEHGSCNDAMEAVYGQAHERDGWGAFLFGCTDGLKGRQSASWYNLRDHLLIE